MPGVLLKLTPVGYKDVSHVEYCRTEFNLIEQVAQVDGGPRMCRIIKPFGLRVLYKCLRNYALYSTYFTNPRSACVYDNIVHRYKFMI